MNWVFRISVILNAALLVVAVWVLGRSSVIAPPAVRSPEVSSVLPVEVRSDLQPATEVQSLAVTVNNAFRWQLLESTNFPEFAAKLRDAGCPERTVRDIIFADAERRHAELEQHESQPAEATSFWLAGRALAEVNRRAKLDRLAGQLALAAELQQLFGVDWAPVENEMHQLEFQAMSRMILGPVPEASYEAAQRWVLSFVRTGEMNRRQHEGVVLARDQAEWSAFVAERQAALSQLLGPMAFEEFQVRSALLEDLFNSKFIHLEDLEITPAELRQVCLIKVRETGWLEDLFRLRHDRSADSVATKRIAFTAALKDALSPGHFDEFVRVQDEDYRQLLRATRDSSLPRRAAQQLYELRQLALPEYQRLKATPDDPEAAAAIAALQATTTRSARQILGEAAFSKISAGQARWITDLSKL